MAANGVRTPFLLDDGTVSKAYGTIGKGMHADLPGHSFVLIDKAGNQRWYGAYPSMWLSNADLLKEVQQPPGQLTRCRVGESEPRCHVRVPHEG